VAVVNLDMRAILWLTVVALAVALLGDVLERRWLA
jgi:hypothetical protein